MYWADGLWTAGSTAGPFYHISSHDNTISLVKWKQTDVRDVNNSDSDPWNIWCRNLIYFKSSSVLWAVQNNGILNYVRNWKSPLVEERRTFCIFWPDISGDQGAIDQLMRCLRWSPSVITKILAPTWSILITWPEYWLVIGQYLSSLRPVIIPSPHWRQTSSNLRLLPGDLVISPSQKNSERSAHAPCQS